MFKTNHTNHDELVNSVSRRDHPQVQTQVCRTTDTRLVSLVKLDNNSFCTEGCIYGTKEVVYKFDITVEVKSTKRNLDRQY